MKKILTLITLLVSVFALCQCSSSNITDLKIDDSKATDATEEVYIMSFNSLINSIDVWYGDANSENIEQYREQISRTIGNLNSMSILAMDYIQISAMSEEFTDFAFNRCQETKKMVGKYLREHNIYDTIMKPMESPKSNK